MKNSFIIGPGNKLAKLDLHRFNHCRTIKGLEVYISPDKLQESIGCGIFIDGYVLPRNSVYAKYNHLSQHELVASLYREYGDDFVNYLKGFFVILIIDGNKVILSNDIHSVKRFYTIRHPEYQIATNDFELKKQLHPETNRYAPTTHAILQHYVNGITPLKDWYYSLPATLLTYIPEEWTQNRYFNPSQLVYCDRESTTLSDYIQTFHTTISNILSFLSPSTVSATLTGGRDTRTILAALLNIGVTPHCFTFGFPSGIDVITAVDVTSKMNIPFSNYYIENLNANSYANLTDEIKKINNPFIHLHRAHRLDAIKKESNYFDNDLDMVFVGAMGGDYIKGEGFNDYIITEFLRLYLTAKAPEDLIIKDILLKHYIEPSKDLITYTKELLASLDLEYGVFNKNVEFNLVHNLIGSTHDIQDINVFMEHAKYVIAPFMDRDIIEALFTSPFSMFSNTRHTNNPFKRLKGGELQSTMINEFSPELAEINFANQYSPKDILGNRLMYVLKRLYLHSFRIKPMPTFSYGNWMYEFVLQKFEKNRNFIESHYNFERAIRDLKKFDHLKHEGYWHKFTNPINLSLSNEHLP